MRIFAQKSKTNTNNEENFNYNDALPADIGLSYSSGMGRG